MQLQGLKILKNALPTWDPHAKGLWEGVTYHTQLIPYLYGYDAYLSLSLGHAGYVLDMTPRICIPSVKNFQMKEILDNEKEPLGGVLMEFGKSGASTFALECKAPLSILQAFTVAIAMVDSSLLVTV